MGGSSDEDDDDDGAGEEEGSASGSASASGAVASAADEEDGDEEEEGGEEARAECEKRARCCKGEGVVDGVVASMCSGRRGALLLLLLPGVLAIVVAVLAVEVDMPALLTALTATRRISGRSAARIAGRIPCLFFCYSFPSVAIYLVRSSRWAPAFSLCRVISSCRARNAVQLTQ